MKPMDDSTPTEPLYLKTQIRLMKGDAIAMGPGKAELLAAIAATGSIAAAGRHMNMSYRRAWLLVETMNQSFSEPLVLSAKGGKHGGGAHLSPLGEQILTLYRQMQADVEHRVAHYSTAFYTLVAQEAALKPD